MNVADELYRYAREAEAKRMRRERVRYWVLKPFRVAWQIVVLAVALVAWVAWGAAAVIRFTVALIGPVALWIGVTGGGLYFLRSIGILGE